MSTLTAMIFTVFWTLRDALVLLKSILPIFGGGLPPPNLLYGISTIRFLKNANLITS